MKLDKSLLSARNSYLEGHKDALSEDIRELPGDFKKSLSNRFFAITSPQIDSRLSGKAFHVSRKLDGHMQLVFFDGNEAFMCGRNGTVRSGLGVLDKIASTLKAKKVNSFIGAGELYIRKDGRCRVYDVTAALGEKGDADSLDIAFFDILELDGASFRGVYYNETYPKLHELLPQNTVETKIVTSIAQVKEIYENWVTVEKSEGIVVRTEDGRISKVKPEISLDAVIIGFAEGINEKRGRVKSFLFAFRRGDNYQVAGKVGNIPESEREGWFTRLSELKTESLWIETDNEGIAFQFVSPEIVIEVKCNDIMTETSTGLPLMNPIVSYGEQWKLEYSIPGAKFINLVFERERTDKTPVEDDIGPSQYENLVEVASEYKPVSEYPASEILRREVYRKTAAGKIMVQKFMVWETHKNDIDKRFPAFVFHYTDFSSGRAEPLKKEIRISSSKDQIMEIADSFIAENVKKGWEKVG
ncbi:hypothetical protein KKF34_13965 [Myxococcota bacterium]|nr:hypothetical protein [Myxococcota bacterium]MBU1382680.1 hypothetical protein [Myxococcota bacterium]MBU1497978.1 hypothetical protein [Myxococcota bacterium]